MPEVNDRPVRLWNFLLELAILSRKHGVIVSGGDLEFLDNPQGEYAINPNNDGPEFGWRSF